MPLRKEKVNKKERNLSAFGLCFPHYKPLQEPGKKNLGTECTVKPTTLRKNQFPWLRVCIGLSGKSEVESEKKEERER